MALVIDINSLNPGLSRREVAAMAGLAKANTRGRMSGEANRMLDKLEADGYVFSTPANAVAKEAAKADKALISQREIDLLAFREWCVTEGIPVPEKRIPNVILNRYVTEVPDFKRREVSTPAPVAPVETIEKSAPVKSEPSNANNFGPTPAQINHALWWEGIDLDGKKIRRSVRDVSADSRVSIGWSPRPVFAWSNVDSSEMIELEPVNA